MTLIRVKRLAYEHSTNYVPPAEDALINTDDIVAVVQRQGERGRGPFLCVTLRDLGDKMIILGTVEELQSQIALAEKSP